MELLVVDFGGAVTVVAGTVVAADFCATTGECEGETVDLLAEVTKDITVFDL